MNEDSKGILNKKVNQIISKFLFANDDPKISKDSVGVGLGLSVSQYIVKAMVNRDWIVCMKNQLLKERIAMNLIEQLIQQYLLKNQYYKNNIYQQ